MFSIFDKAYIKGNEIANWYTIITFKQCGTMYTKVSDSENDL